jgi:hypothetical protein
MRILVFGAVIGLGCGSVTARLDVDSGSGEADVDGGADVAVRADVGSCFTDTAGYTAFADFRTIPVDGGSCQATYTVTRGVNTFNCTCTDPALCSQASLQLTAEGQACIQKPLDLDASVDAGCVATACTTCVNGSSVPVADGIQCGGGLCDGVPNFTGQRSCTTTNFFCAAGVCTVKTVNCCVQLGCTSSQVACTGLAGDPSAQTMCTSVCVN